MTINLWPHTVTIVRAPVIKDDFNDDIRDWANATSTDEDTWSVQPAEGDEATVQRDTVVSRWVARRLGDSILVATDRIVHKAETYEVDGEVQRWQDFGALSHVVCTLRRSESS